MDNNILKLGKELTLKDKLFQKSFRSRLQEYKANNKVNPWVIELDPTTACNLACHGCISANLLNQGGFERERLKKLAKEFFEMGVKAVVLIGGGEPMAHPEFGTIVNYFHDHDIDVGVTSNGTFIRRYLEPLAYKTKWLRVSMDAGSEKVFQKYRPHASGKSQFLKIIDQMKELAKVKKGKLGYSFLIMSKYDDKGNFLETNAIDILNAAKVARDIGCDYFEVKPSFNMMHFMNELDNTTKEIVLEQLNKVQEYKENNFNIISPYTLGDNLEGKKNQIKEYKRCLTSEFRTVLTPSGAYVCPYHRGNLNMKIGDPNTQSLKEIWEGAQRKEKMKQLDPREHCRFHCIRHYSNIELENFVANEKEPEVIEDYDRFI